MGEDRHVIADRNASNVAPTFSTTGTFVSSTRIRRNRGRPTASVWHAGTDQITSFGPGRFTSSGECCCGWVLLLVRESPSAKPAPQASMTPIPVRRVRFGHGRWKKDCKASLRCDLATPTVSWRAFEEVDPLHACAASSGCSRRGCATSHRVHGRGGWAFRERCSASVGSTEWRMIASQAASAMRFA
jgi:hypothetical protein